MTAEVSRSGPTIRVMERTRTPQLHVTAVVECPWCEAWTELEDDATAIACDGCGVVVPAPELPERELLAA